LGVFRRRASGRALPLRLWQHNRSKILGSLRSFAVHGRGGGN